MEYITPFLYLLNTMAPYLLLGFLLAGVIHAYVPRRLYARYLSQPDFRSVALAALFGVPLPLCSCGVIPTAMSLRREGASKGAVTSFLIATPQTGVDSIVATYWVLGLPFAVIRPVVALGDGVGGRVDGQSADPQRDRRYPSGGGRRRGSSQRQPVRGGVALRIRGYDPGHRPLAGAGIARRRADYDSGARQLFRLVRRQAAAEYGRRAALLDSDVSLCHGIDSDCGGADAQRVVARCGAGTARWRDRRPTRRRFW